MKNNFGVQGATLHLFDHLVKPILLYGCEIWTPIDLKYKQSKNLQSTAKHDFVTRDNFPHIIQNTSIKLTQLRNCI